MPMVVLRIVLILIACVHLAALRLHPIVCTSKVRHNARQFQRSALVHMRNEEKQDSKTVSNASNVRSVPKGDGALEEDEREGFVWKHIKRLFEEAPKTQAHDIPPLIEGVTEQVEAAIAERRRRLNAKLGESLQNFRQEVLDEASLQVGAFVRVERTGG